VGLWILSLALPAMAQEIAVGGRVLLPDGAPLAEAEVRLLPLLDTIGAAARPLDDSQAEPVARAATDDDGRYRLLAPRAGLWSVRIDVPGFVPTATALRPLIEPLELPDVTLAADAGLSVRVADEQGRPLASAAVAMETDRARWSRDGSRWYVPARHAVTDADGLARLARADRERVALSVSADGYAFHAVRGVSGTSSSLMLGRGAGQRLDVRGSDDEPLAGVLVLAGSPPVRVGSTDESGRLTLRVEPGRTLELALLADDGRRLETRLNRPGAGEKPERLVLADRSAVAGRVIDAESRRPIEGGLVWDAGNPAEAATTDAGGGFVLAGPAGQRLRLTAGAQGYLAGESREIQLLDDGRPGPTLALRPAAAIEGRVVDLEGRPIAGARVELEPRRTPGMVRIEFGAPTGPQRALTDAKGGFRLSPVDPERPYTARATAEGFAPTELAITDLQPYGTKKNVRLELGRGHTLSGTIVDGEGGRIREARVVARPGSGAASQGMMVIAGPAATTEFEAESDGDGSFTLEGLPEGAFDIEVTRRGFAKVRLPALEIAAGDEPRDLGEIVMQPGERVVGIVTDTDGQPVEGVEVFADSGGGAMMVVMAGMGGPERRPDATSDPAGWFQIDDLDAQAEYRLRFSRRGFVDARLTGIKLPRPEPLEVRLDPSSDVSGRVVDAEGEPIPGARVEMTRSRSLEMGNRAVMTMMMASEETDRDGRFVFEDQEPGVISLGARASGYREAKRDNIEIPKGEDLTGIELPLPPGAVVEGRVLAPDGRPAIGAGVGPVTESPDPMGGMLDRETSDGSGHFRLEGLEAGPVAIEARHPDYPRVVKDVELREGINVVELEFSGGHEVSGLVSDTAGRPVPGASLRLVAAGRFWGGGPETRSKGDGTFVMPGVQDGDYGLWAEAEGYAPSAGKQRVSVAGEPVAGLEVRLDPGAVLLGRVSGLPPEDFARVGIQLEGDTPHFEDAPVDTQGNVRIEHLLPGSYTVIGSVARSGRQARQRVVIEPGMPEATVQLEFGAGVTLSGRAVQGDQPIAGAMLYGQGTDADYSGWTETDFEGRFTLEGLEPGRYRLQLQHWQSGLSYTEEVDLSTSREIVLDVPTAIVGGRVTDASDRGPLPGVRVTLTPVDATSGSAQRQRAATTDVDGRFTLDSVGSGDWTLAASKPGYAAASQPVRVEFQRDVRGLNVALEPTEGLTIEARLASGAIPDELRIAVLDAAGQALTGGTYATGENGRVRLTSVPPGSWQLVLTGVGSAVTTLTAQAPGPPLSVALEPPCSLRIRVADLLDGATVAAVTVDGADGRPFRTLSWLGAVQSEWRMTGGQLELGSLPPGNWTVKVTGADGRSWQATATTSAAAPAELLIE